MSLAYRLGCSAIRAALVFDPLSRGLSAFSRIWSRQARIYRHLQSAHYDGVIDGGANIGEFAGLVRAALPAADLVCVEPHPDCAKTLRGLGYRVVEAALWHSAGRLTLSQPTSASTSSTLMASGHGAVGEWEVATVRLDELSVAGAKILLKLDLQGAEIEAFKGMGNLWDRVTGVLCEVSLGDGGNYEAIRALLGEHGFREASTLNELEENGRVIEADKLWVKT